MAQTIELTKGLIAVFDDSDEHLIRPHNWCAFACNGDLVYAVRAWGDGPTLMHRLILGLRSDDARIVDHRDRDGLNNRRHNLRICTRSQNLQNQRLRVDNRTGFKGVSFRIQSGRYLARIKNGRRERFLGSFRTAEDAARAYDEAAIRMFGEFARLNFQDDGLIVSNYIYR